VLWLHRDALRPVGAAVRAPTSATEPAARSATLGAAGPMVVAVGGPTARQVSVMATPLARARGGDVHVLHVIETDVVAGEDTAELETTAQARALLDACMDQLRNAGVPVTGELLHSYGTHRDVAMQILRRVDDVQAGVIVLGPDTRHGTLTTNVTGYIAGHAPAHVVVVNPAAGALGRPVAVVAGSQEQRDETSARRDVSSRRG
jgi:nucleotide-binding universal stress UspA family protein